MNSKTMNSAGRLVIFTMAWSLPVGSVWAQSGEPEPEQAVVSGQQTTPEKPLRRVRRAARPEFESGDGENVFFQDLFGQALQGPRPPSTEDPAAPGSVALANDGNSDSDSGDSDSGNAWSAVIPASALEDEIKRQQIRLSGLVTNPGQFQTRNTEIRESLQILAMTFAIISQFDQPVRWKDQADSAIAALGSAAAMARKTDLPAFESARDTTQRLTDLVRGGNFGKEPDAKPVSDWSTVIDRSAIMERLDYHVSRPLKTATASNDSFADDAESILHDAALIAAMGRVLKMPDLLDYDDEDYQAQVDQMILAAQALSEATRQNDYEAALSSLNQLNQSCVDCHADWR